MKNFFEIIIRQRIKLLVICVCICLQLICSSCGEKNKQLLDSESTPQSYDENVVSDDISVNGSEQNNENQTDVTSMITTHVEHTIECFSDGRERQEKFWDAAGNLTEIIDYYYDEEFRLLSIVSSEENGNNTPEKEFTYDEAGNLVLKRTYLWGDISYYQDGSMMKTTTV